MWLFRSKIWKKIILTEVKKSIVVLQVLNVPTFSKWIFLETVNLLLILKETYNSQIFVYFALFWQTPPWQQIAYAEE